jgi:hypothetical protein
MTTEQSYLTAIVIFVLILIFIYYWFYVRKMEEYQKEPNAVIVPNVPANSTEQPIATPVTITPAPTASSFTGYAAKLVANMN